MAKCKELRGADLTVRDLISLGIKGNHEPRIEKFGYAVPGPVYPWRDPRGETAKEAEMSNVKATEVLRVYGGLGLVEYAQDTKGMKIIMYASGIGEDLAEELGEAGRNGVDVELVVGGPKRFSDILTQDKGNDGEPMDLDSLKKQVETVGLVIKPQTSDRRGYAARAAMRVYARLMEGEDPVEADMWLSLAQHYDIVVEIEKRKGKP